MFTVRGSSVTPHVKTQLLLHPIPAVQFVMVGFFKGPVCNISGALEYNMHNCLFISGSQILHTGPLIHFSSVCGFNQLQRHGVCLCVS